MTSPSAQKAAGEISANDDLVRGGWLPLGKHKAAEIIQQAITEAVDAAVGPKEKRVKELEAALGYVWDLADLNSWEVGVHHLSTDLVAQRLTYGCSGCEASVVRSAESNGLALAAMKFPHAADCKYVKLRDLVEAPHEP